MTQEFIDDAHPREEEEELEDMQVFSREDAVRAVQRFLASRGSKEEIVDVCDDQSQIDFKKWGMDSFTPRVSVFEVRTSIGFYLVEYDGLVRSLV